MAFFEFVKRVLIAVLAVCLLQSTTGVAWAYGNVIGYGPKNYKGEINPQASGIFYAPPHFKIYASADETSAVIEEIDWKPGGNSYTIYSTLQQQALNPPNVFFCFYPGQKIAMMNVVSDNDAGWAEVVYDKKNNKTGWVPLRSYYQEKTPDAIKDWPGHFAFFQTWLDFIKLNTHNDGFYWLTGVSDYHRNIRTSPEDKAKFLQVMMIRSMKVRHIKGNWMLVEIVDFDRSRPLGWLRWRDDSGNIMVFPNVGGGYKPPTIMTGSFIN